MSDYEALKVAGHTPAKAAEIALDAKRGDQHALAWIAALREARKP
jgi:hypothetical protein